MKTYSRTTFLRVTDVFHENGKSKSFSAGGWGGGVEVGRRQDGGRTGNNDGNFSTRSMS